MTWTWKLYDANGDVVDAAQRLEDEPVFPSQADAETWVGEQWQELLEDGIETVSLFDGDVEVYGHMSLKPAQ